MFAVCFVVGAFVYPGMEVWFDNTSHRSMGIVGGLAFSVSVMYDLTLRLPYIALCVLIAMTITFMEYWAGRIWNKDYSIWDYREHRFNLHGHISIRFFCLWLFGMSHVIIWLGRTISEVIL